MSALYGTITGDASRTDASRRGHKHISGHVRGWNLGVRVDGMVDRAGFESFEVYVTGGSNGGTADNLIGRVELHDGRRYFFPHYTGEEVSRGEFIVPAVKLAD